MWAVSEYGTIATVTSNDITAPDGSTTADRINFAPDGTGQSRRTQSIVFSNTTYTVSAYVKKRRSEYCKFICYCFCVTIPKY